jgi:hypothetical protein
VFPELLCNGRNPVFTFVRCVIRYNGGLISAKRLVFSQCVFQFQVLGVPAPSGVIAMKTLTRADPNSAVEITT